MRLRFLVAAVAVLWASLAARADTYDYNFFFDDGAAGNASFDFQTNVLAPEDVLISSPNCTLLSYTCDQIELAPDLQEIGFFDDGSYLAVVSPVPAGDFTVGDHDMGGGDYFNITDLSTSATPEPSSIALLGTGLLATCGILRRRFV